MSMPSRSSWCYQSFEVAAVDVERNNRKADANEE
jgi:hypothetical protein